MKKTFLLISALMVVAMLASCAPAAPAPAAAQPTAAPAAAEPTAAPAAAKPLDFTTVVKIAGINWFNRMETGVVEWGKGNGVNANLVGPSPGRCRPADPHHRRFDLQESGCAVRRPHGPDSA